MLVAPKGDQVAAHRRDLDVVVVHPVEALVQAQLAAPLRPLLVEVDQHRDFLGARVVVNAAIEHRHVLADRHLGRECIKIHAELGGEMSAHVGAGQLVDQRLEARAAAAGPRTENCRRHRWTGKLALSPASASGLTKPGTMRQSGTARSAAAWRRTWPGLSIDMRSAMS